MTDLLDSNQLAQFREHLQDVTDTIAFPIVLIKTTYTPSAFQTNPTTQTYDLNAIRERGSRTQSADTFRNEIGAVAATEYDIYISWLQLEEAGLVDDNDLVDISRNDLVRMEGEIHEIVAASALADVTKEPILYHIKIKRRFADADGAAEV